MINWLSSLFDKKCEEVESSGSENVAEKNEVNGQAGTLGSDRASR